MIQHIQYVCNLFEHQPVTISKVKYINYLKAGALKLLNLESLKKTNVRQSSVQHNKLMSHDGLFLYNNKNFIQVLYSSSLRHKCLTNWDTPYEIKVCRLQTRDQGNERTGEWGE